MLLKGAKNDNVDTEYFVGFVLCVCVVVEVKDNTAWMRAYQSDINASEDMSYVSADGNYGSDTILLFPYNALTEKQWDRLGSLSDSDKLPYVLAIIGNEDLSEWEE